MVGNLKCFVADFVLIPAAKGCRKLFNSRQSYIQQNTGRFMRHDEVAAAVEH